MGLLDIFGILPCNWGGAKVITEGPNRECVHLKDGFEVWRHKKGE